MNDFDFPASAIEIETGAEHISTITVKAASQNEAMAIARTELLNRYPSDKFKKQKVGE